MFSMCSLLCLAAVALSTIPALAASPTENEFDAVRRWEAENFQRPKAAPTALPRESLPGLYVLANHDPVQLNNRNGKPMKIGEKEFSRGLYCHALSQVLVRLPAPGRTFTALAGSDNNEQTSGGRGSIRFSVQAAGKALFQSAVQHGGDAALPVSVPLDGAREFLLVVDDAGDGIACDQADWADAKVTLSDGKEIWLGDLPLVEEVQPLPERAAAHPPFTFLYGDRFSDEFLAGWQFQSERKQLDAARVQHTLTYTDPQTGLRVRLTAIAYQDFPTVEWMLTFKNTGTQDTPILEAIRPLDTRFQRRGTEEFLLHHFIGSPCQPVDYRPLADVLGPKTRKRIATTGGRPTNSDLPCFNIEMGDGGVIAVLSWPGQWAAHFLRDDKDGLRVTGEQELTRFTLHPGEEARTPMVVLQFYRGDWIRAQNIWRRWMLAHNSPRPNGKPLAPQFAACSSHQFGEMIHADTASQILFVDRYLEEKLPLDYWWMDAGWYYHDGAGWPKVGTWEVDKTRFPNGLREISDHAHAKGVKTLLWFEPERVAADTWIAKNHPEWVLGGAGGGLLNLGNPDAWNWLVNHVDKLLTEQGIDFYRQDFNMDPLPYWRANDAPDRQGITEIRHVTGYLAYWDELQRRHPGLPIDSCASGGRRNDLETLRRAVPLLRSDYIMEPMGNQGHTYGLSFWLPFYGTGSSAIDSYGLRSVLCPYFNACIDMRNRELDFDEARRLFRQWKEEMALNYFGDYYPLTPYSLAADTWIAWQFDRPEAGQGMVQAFRRAENSEEFQRFRLRGLNPKERYQFTDLDTNRTITLRGKEAMEEGVLVTIPAKPGAVVLTYKKQ